MEVKTVKEKKKELEDLISTAVYRFEAETECRVKELTLHSVNRIGGRIEPGIVIADVEVR